MCYKYNIYASREREVLLIVLILLRDILKCNLYVDGKRSAMETIDPRPMQTDAVSKHIVMYNLLNFVTVR